MLGVVLVDVHRAFGHGKKRLRRLQILAHLCLVQPRRHLLKRLELVADAPDHEIGVGPETDG